MKFKSVILLAFIFFINIFFINVFSMEENNFVELNINENYLILKFLLGNEIYYDDFYTLKINNQVISEDKISNLSNAIFVVKKIPLNNINPGLLNINIIVKHFNDNIYEYNQSVFFSKKITLGNETITYFYENNWTVINQTIKDIGNYELEIPKKILKEINESNFKSNLNYKIIKKDPLIAWYIDKSPANLEYRINKKISKEDIQELKIKKAEKNVKVLFSLLIFIVFIAILTQVIIISKKKKK